MCASNKTSICQVCKINMCCDTHMISKTCIDCFCLDNENIHVLSTHESTNATNLKNNNNVDNKNTPKKIVCSDFRADYYLNGNNRTIFVERAQKDYISRLFIVFILVMLLYCFIYIYIKIAYIEIELLSTNLKTSEIYYNKYIRNLLEPAHNGIE
jgi:hypothetical protein